MDAMTLPCLLLLHVGSFLPLSRPFFKALFSITDFSFFFFSDSKILTRCLLPSHRSANQALIRCAIAAAT